MQIEISKKLLEVLVGPVQEFIQEDSIITYCKLGDFDSWKSISIYQLAFDIKEWAYNQGLDTISSHITTGVVSGKKRYNCKIVKYRAFTLVFSREFMADSEIEAIFKACRWVNNNIDIVKGEEIKEEIKDEAE